MTDDAIPPTSSPGESQPAPTESQTPASPTTGTKVHTVIEITKMVTSVCVDKEGNFESVKEAPVVQEFEQKQDGDDPDKFVNDLIAMGWIPRGRPNNTSSTITLHQNNTSSTIPKKPNNTSSTIPQPPPQPRTR